MALLNLIHMSAHTTLACAPHTHASSCIAAYNKLANLTKREMERGIVSYGSNNAHSVAIAANKLGIDATLVMPTFVRSDIRRRIEQQYGAKTVIHGQSMSEAEAECYKIGHEQEKVSACECARVCIVVGVGLYVLRCVE